VANSNRLLNNYFKPNGNIKIIQVTKLKGSKITHLLWIRVLTWNRGTQQTENPDMPKLSIQVLEESTPLCTMSQEDTIISTNLSKIQALLPSIKSKPTLSIPKEPTEANTQELSWSHQQPTLQKVDKLPSILKKIPCSMVPLRVVTIKEQPIYMAVWPTERAVMEGSKGAMKLSGTKRCPKNILPSEKELTVLASKVFLVFKYKQYYKSILTFA